MVAAAALGNYPTPLVGHGGAAVLGYLLSVALLPSGEREMSSSLAPVCEVDPHHRSDEPFSKLVPMHSPAAC